MDGQLTVVIPIYNVEMYLKKCIDSVLNQTLPVAEIILVDDGSKDSSGEIADEYAVKHKNIKVIHQKNGGLSAARNSGIDLASNPYIAFVDSDDYIEPVMYEKLMRMLLDRDADISFGGVLYEQETGEKYSPYKPGIQKVWNKEKSLIELNSYRYFNMSFCNAIFKRSLFEEDAYGEGALRFPVGKLSEDFYLMHRILARAKTVTYMSTPFYHYIQRENSISRNVKINLAPMDASIQQLIFYRKWFPELAYAAETACFFAHASIYTTYCRSGQQCPAELLQRIDLVCRKYFFGVLRNPHIPKIKKLQAIAFCVAKPIYREVVMKRKHR